MVSSTGKCILSLSNIFGPFISGVDVAQYRIALDHIAARTGTGIPTGGAEQALASLCHHDIDIWSFLNKFLRDDDNSVQESSTLVDVNPGHHDGSAAKTFCVPGECEKTESSVESPGHRETGVVGGRKTSKGTESDKSVPSFPLSLLSKALLAFCATRSSGEDCTLTEVAIQDLMNFLYLGGQTKVPPRIFRL